MLDDFNAFRELWDHIFDFFLFFLDKTVKIIFQAVVSAGDLTIDYSGFI